MKPTKKPTKYRAKKCVLDGRKFDSEAEMKRAMILKEWLNQGAICDLEYQPRFTLQESFRDNRGRLNRAVEYVADFSYFDVQEFRSVVLEVKGFKTEASKIKMKWFRAKFPDITHIVIVNGKDEQTIVKRKKRSKL